MLMNMLRKLLTTAQKSEVDIEINVTFCILRRE